MDCKCKNINTYGCILFLSKYGNAGSGQLISSILEFSKRSSDMHQNFRNWIKWTEDNFIDFGGKPIYISKIPWMRPHWIFDYNFEKTKGWSEIFQFIVNLENEKNGSPMK